MPKSHTYVVTLNLKLLDILAMLVSIVCGLPTSRASEVILMSFLDFNVQHELRCCFLAYISITYSIQNV